MSADTAIVRSEDRSRAIRIVSTSDAVGASAYRVELAPSLLEIGSGSVSALTRLRIDPTGVWIRTPSNREIDLSSRKPLQRIVLALAHGRLASGRIVSHDALVAAGWPGEHFSRDAGRGRLRVAIYELRKLGLKDSLLSSRAGHRLLHDIEWMDQTSTPQPD
jgi:hypothetical protein